MPFGCIIVDLLHTIGEKPLCAVKSFVKVYKPGAKKCAYLVKLAGGKNLDNRGRLVVR